MKQNVIQARELGEAELARWSEIQDGNPELASPYFCAQFTRAVGRVKDDAFVGILEEGNRIVGFFPFQLRGRRIGKPIGWPLSDYQGVIAPPGESWDPGVLLAGCGLDVFDFDHLLVSQRSFLPHHVDIADSPYLDLRQGYDAYAAAREGDGSRVVNSRMGTKWRKLERELGPLRYELHDASAAAFEALIRWKSEQYRRTNAIDLFAHDWPARLLDDIRGIQEPGFAGLLSSLYAGDTLVAVHLGMRSRRVWHYWFPAYGEQFHKYSPGYRLIVEMAQCAPSLGIDMIDLGRGDMSYKQRLGSASIPVAQGFVARPSLAGAGRIVWQAIGSAIERLPESFAHNLPRRAYRRFEARARVP
ncbi:MAG: GNAT family N-acetyltransferase [Kiloniellales bacterium]